MNEERKPTVSAEKLGAIANFVRTLRLVWRLLKDPRVPTFPKLIIPAGILYILSPIDLIPDFILGLGQVDDIAIFFLSISLFIEMCPPALVAEHRAALAAENARTKPPQEDVIEGSYRVVSDDK